MFKPKKALGQNFLTDKTVALEMVEALGIKDGDEIIEIGPGKGLLTEILFEKSKSFKVKIGAVEIDGELYEKLKDRFSKESSMEILHDDILQFLPKFSSDKEIKIIGSIPYYITSPIIHQIIKMENRPKTVVLLMQKEVAEKIKSTPPDSSYMSSFVQTFFDIKYLGKVPSKKFYPEPQVDGGIVKMTAKDADFTSEAIKKYEGFLHRAYSNPRKMLNKIFKKEELERGTIDGNLRAQNLGAKEWLAFFNILNEI